MVLTSATAKSISMKCPSSADIFSYVYDIMFEEDVTKDIEELQQEARIRREEEGFTVKREDR